MKANPRRPHDQQEEKCHQLEKSVQMKANPSRSLGGSLRHPGSRKSQHRR
jgi:hypothetical protein